ncbi:hypothetical protein EVG20_g9942, partial [Dentipellis fragilis]
MTTPNTNRGRSARQGSSSARARSRSPTLDPALFSAMSLATAHGFSDDHHYNGVANELMRGANGIEQQILASKQPRLSKERVFRVLTSVLGEAAEVGFEALSVGVQLIELAPIPGLASVGRSLLHIWEVLEHARFNRRDCEDLAAFCLDAVDIVCMKVSDTGKAFPEELQGPVQTLDDALWEASNLIEEQGPRSHLSGHRDIGHRIEQCRTRIQGSLSLFTAAMSLDIMKTMRALSPPHDISRSRQELPHEGPRTYTQTPSQHTQSRRATPVNGPLRAEMDGDDLVITVKSSAEIRLGPPTVVVTHPYDMFPSIEDTTAPAPSTSPHVDQPTEKKRNYARDVHRFVDSTPVSVGAVGYYHKENGSFITLFNALQPADSLNGVATKIRSLSTFGSTKRACIFHPQHSSRNIFRSERRDISFNVKP